MKTTKKRGRPLKVPSETEPDARRPVVFHARASDVERFKAAAVADNRTLSAWCLNHLLHVIQRMEEQT